MTDRRPDPTRHTAPDTRPDAALVAAYAAGDVRAFEVLYHRHERDVFRFALRFAGDRALADDVVQETFHTLVDRAPGLEVSGSLTGWLYVIAKRTALRLRERAERHQGDPDVVAAAVDRQRAVTTDETVGDVDRMVAGLPEAQREVVLLRFVDDWPLERIATALDVPVGTVKSRLHTALRTLREAGVHGPDVT